MKNSSATLFIAHCLLLIAYFSMSASAQPQDSAVATILNELKGGDPEMQAVVIAAIRDLPTGVEITEALAKELPNLSVRGQVQLLSALGDRGDRAAQAAVIPMGKAADEAVRIAALRALGQIGDANSVMLLAQRAATSSGDEQKAARESLYRLRGPAANKATVEGIQTVDGTILASIPQADPRTKVELISSIGERNITAGAKILLETAKDPNCSIQLESLKVLKTVAGKEHLPALVEILVNLQSDSARSETEKTIAAVARKIPDKNRRAEPVLTELPKVSEAKNRCSLLSVLGKIGDSTALPAIREAISSQDTKVQDTAIRVLSEWPTAEPVLDLLKIAESSANSANRILALRGFVRLLGLESERSPEETIEMYKKAMELAPNTDEKKRVLSGLANTKSLGAMQMAATYLQDEDLHQEAELAAVKIAEAIHSTYPQESKELLKKIVQTSKNDSLRERAGEVINQIEQLKEH
jgi:HEAT repeat protein